MLQVVRVFKSYTTGNFTQVALDGVSLAFRDNEFVSILGPSGSGKTTLLNVIGGLDHFDDGDLVIDGISTRKYRDRDWDAYRNNRIGFVFQSYNLILHQTILANVELALTLSGVTPRERRERAVAALGKVGLAEHVDKRPSQLSGGQMQRVAIARALINDPEILLADEPTGALDSKTSVQVMDLLREVAQDRLVIMVTHNPELAMEYSTRIVELADGKIRSDSNPFEPTGKDLRAAKPPRLTQMSFFTALTLSFNNLMTKKGRTLMTAFAGSIGIIGIAAILSLANGVNAYIQEVEEEALSVYPLQIMSSGFDMTSMIVDVQDEEDGAGDTRPSSKNTVHETRVVTGMFSRVGKNDLASLKEYLDDDGGSMSRCVQDIEYLYGVTPQIFLDKKDGSFYQVNPDRTFEALGMGGSSALMTGFSSGVFSQMPQDTSLFDEQYDTLWGRWPEKLDELVLVLGRSGGVTDFMSYAMGLRDPEELKEMVSRFAEQEDIEVPEDERDYTIDELVGVSYVVVPACDLYVHEDEFGVWTSKADDKDYLEGLLEDAQRLKIVGIMQAKEDVDATTLSRGIYYTSKLTDWLMEEAASSEIVVEQLDNPTINVISGVSFDKEATDEGPALDFSSLFSIDEAKLAGAFVMDPTALDSGMADLGGAFDLSSLAGSMDLSTLASSMDLSSMQLPTIDLSQLALPQIDPVALQLDLGGLDLSGIDLRDVFTDDLREALGPTFTLDASTLFDGVDVQGMVDFTSIATSVNDIINGLPAYLEARGAAYMDITQLNATVQEYFSLPEVQQTLRLAVEGSTYMTEPAYTRLAENIRSQVVANYDDPNRLAALDEAQRRLVERLIDAVGDRISETLARALSDEVVTYVTQTLVVTFQTLLSQVVSAFMQSLMETLSAQLASAISTQMEGAMTQIMANMAGAVHIDEQVFAEAFSFNMDEKEFSELMTALMTTERTSLDGNLAKFGYADVAKPSEVDIYPIDFKAKEEVKSILDAYNDDMRESGDDDRVITYTDIVGALMSSVTDIVNMISYVLVAFVSISLIVSSIMIGVITYISVLERKKEIGILRSIGASKRDVSRVFNAETVIEGLVSGLMGVLITFVATFPANAIVEANFGVERVARLPFGAACILVGVSIALSFIAGLLPARKAAKADPVEALRSE